MGSSIGGLIGQGIGNIFNAGFAKKAARKGLRTATRLGNELTPTVDTGFSTFDPRTGKFNLDPSIRQGQEDFRTATESFRGDINQGFDTFDEGLFGVREGFAGLRSNFEGNQSGFREASLAPLRERIARGRGELDRELNRTGVRGSFSNQQRTGFELDAGRDLSIREAEIENTRINRLGDFLQIDANLLKEGLASSTGRIELLAKLEESLAGISTERFEQELALLGLPANFFAGLSKRADILLNAEGVKAQADVDFIDVLLDPLQGKSPGSFGGGGSTGSGISPTGSDISGTPF